MAKTPGIVARETQSKGHDRVVEMVREIAKETYKDSHVSVPGKFLPQDRHYGLENLEGRRGIQPDVWVKIPNGWRVVYEIWAQEAIDKATYELFRIALSRNVRKYNIICLGSKSKSRWSKKKAYHLAKLVLDNLKGAHLKPK